MYGFRDEVRARTSKTNLRTLITVYQFASTPDFEMTGRLSEAMDGSLPYYDALGLKSNPKLLKIEHFGDYFPHFSQVRGLSDATIIGKRTHPNPTKDQLTQPKCAKTPGLCRYRRFSACI